MHSSSPKTKLKGIFDRPGSMSAGGRRNGDITEIQGISARKIGQDQGRHVKKSRITTVYTVQRSSINKATAQFMSRKNMTVLFLASCLAIQVHDITNHIFFFLIFSCVFFSFPFLAFLLVKTRLVKVNKQKFN